MLVVYQEFIGNPPKMVETKKKRSRPYAVTALQADISAPDGHCTF